jgi:hypothetical protein
MAEDASGENAGSNGGYVHDPGEFTDDGGDDRDRTTRAYHPDVPRSEEFGRKGWGLVAALFVAFVVVPGFILYLPYSGGLIESFGLTMRDAYLTLPLVPALVLAALAVWVAVSG